MHRSVENVSAELWKAFQITDNRSSAAEIEQAVLRSIKKLPEVREVLETEAAFRFDPAAASHDEIIVAYRFLEAVAIQRVAPCRRWKHDRSERFLTHSPPTLRGLLRRWKTSDAEQRQSARRIRI